MTGEEAAKLYDSGFWEDMDDTEIAVFQLKEDHLCVPFSRFLNAVERTLGRPVSSYELVLNRWGVLAEIIGDQPTINYLNTCVQELKITNDRLTRSVAFYKQRADLLQQAQKNMRDPERTMVCDILANGALLSDPKGDRYGVKEGER